MIEIPSIGNLLIQIAIFLIVMISLSKFLFKPLLQIIEERKRRIEEPRRRAKELMEEAERRLAEYELKIYEARQRAAEEKEMIRKEAMAAEREIILRAQDQGNKMIEEMRERIQREAEEARKILRRDAEKIAFDLAEKILGRKVINE